MITDAPLVDIEQLEEFRTVLGQRQFEMLLTAFLVELDTRPATIARCVAERNLPAARTAAHLLKGAALNIGSPRLAVLAAAVEDHRGDGLPSLTAQLLACTRATREAVQRALAFLSADRSAA